MIELIVKKGNLFDALNHKDLFVHACNGQGVWGSGIAVGFREGFPNAYELYKHSPNRSGDGYIIYENCMIGCLITSKNYGKKKDPPSLILKNTELAIRNMLTDNVEGDIIIHSPKINAGLFEVPWQKTKKVIKKVGNEFDFNIKWIVWEL